MQRFIFAKMHQFKFNTREITFFGKVIYNLICL